MYVTYPKLRDSSTTELKRQKKLLPKKDLEGWEQIRLDHINKLLKERKSSK